MFGSRRRAASRQTVGAGDGPHQPVLSTRVPRSCGGACSMAVASSSRSALVRGGLPVSVAVAGDVFGAADGVEPDSRASLRACEEMLTLS